jgi:hypothetical protein
MLTTSCAPVLRGGVTETWSSPAGRGSSEKVSGPYPVPVIVCGGRTHTLSASELQILDQILSWLSARHEHTGIVVWEGDAPGVDRQASAFARSRGYLVETFRPAQTELSFVPATIARNEEMAARASKRGGGYTIAFSGNNGTDDMVKRSLRHGLRVFDFRPVVDPPPLPSV